MKIDHLAIILEKDSWNEAVALVVPNEDAISDQVLKAVKIAIGFGREVNVRMAHRVMDLDELMDKLYEIHGADKPSSDGVK